MSVFKDDYLKNNIEVGAGKGDFGQIYYPQCFLTDNDQRLKSSPDIKIDCFCDAKDLMYWENDRFDHVISCNPYGYGFDEVEDSEKLLDEFIRVLKNNGKIVIIGSDKNKYCAPDRVKKRVANYIDGKVNLKLTFNVFDSKREYVNYKFWTCDGYVTTPNKKIEIYVTK